MKVTTPVIQVILAIFTIGFLPKVQAVVPAPDGGYPGGNTAEGQNALLNLTTGGFNTALGFLSLKTDATGQLNTAVGAGTLLTNTSDNKPFACWHQPFKQRLDVRRGKPLQLFDSSVAALAPPKFFHRSD